MTQVTRRTLTKGAAWSIPAVSVVGAAPAFAASPSCGKPSIGIQYVWYFNWGDPGSATQTTAQLLEFSDLQFTFNNLPKGVTVDRIEWGMWMDLRYTGNPVEWRNRGIPYPDFKTDARSNDPTTTTQGCWSGSCGWSNLTWGGVTTSNGLITGGTPRVFRDGSTRQAWQLKEAWTNTGANFTVTDDPVTGCRTIVTGKMGVSDRQGAELRGKTGFDSHWFRMSTTQTRWNKAADDSGVAKRDYQTIHGAIAYLSNNTTVSTDNSPSDNPSSWL